MTSKEKAKELMSKFVGVYERYATDKLK